MVDERYLEKIKEFREKFYKENRDLFDKLAGGQSPDTMMVTCSDSRIVPHTKTGAYPGDLFVFRNMGNFVPPFSGDAKEPTGVAAFLEYGVKALGAKHIVILGHTNCGAIKGLLQGNTEGQVEKWLRNAHRLRGIILEKYKTGDVDLVSRGCEENVRHQVENIRTYPFIKEPVERGEITIHGWLYDVRNGSVYAIREGEDEFVLLG